MIEPKTKTIRGMSDSSNDARETIETLTERIDDIERRTHRIEENVQARLQELIDTFGVIADAMVFLSGSIEHLRVSMDRQEQGENYKWKTPVE